MKPYCSLKHRRSNYFSLLLLFWRPKKKSSVRFWACETMLCGCISNVSVKTFHNQKQVVNVCICACLCECNSFLLTISYFTKNTFANTFTHSLRTGFKKGDLQPHRLTGLKSCWAIFEKVVSAFHNATLQGILTGQNKFWQWASTQADRGCQCLQCGWVFCKSKNTYLMKSFTMTLMTANPPCDLQMFWPWCRPVGKLLVEPFPSSLCWRTSLPPLAETPFSWMSACLKKKKGNREDGQMVIEQQHRSVDCVVIHPIKVDSRDCQVGSNTEKQRDRKK